jgi:hypothetical protein
MAPPLIAYIFLDTLVPSAHNPASFSGRLLWQVRRGGERFPLPAAGTLISSGERRDAISARLDGAVFESGMLGARTLAARAGIAARKLQPLRGAVAQRAAAAGSAVSNAAAAVGELSPRGAPALIRAHSGWRGPRFGPSAEIAGAAARIGSGSAAPGNSRCGFVPALTPAEFDGRE